MSVCIKDLIQNMNLVIGCTVGCPYCYARNNVRRYHMTEDFSKPEFFPAKLRLMEKPPDLLPLYEEIYNKRNRSYFEVLEKKAKEMARQHGCRFVDNETPYERVPKGHPTIVDYFYHEEVRGTENSGVRNKG